MSYCLFCQFAEGKIPCKKSFEDESVFSFVDWNPWEGMHIVAFPKKHIGLIQKNTETFSDERKKLYDSIPRIVEYAHISDDYLVLTEEEEDSIGQDQEHIHIHITGKQKNE